MKNTKGIGFTGLLTIAFIILKLLNLIKCSWFWVFSPIWIYIILLLVVIFICFIIFK